VGWWDFQGGRERQMYLGRAEAVRHRVIRTEAGELFVLVQCGIGIGMKMETGRNLMSLTARLIGSRRFCLAG